MLVICSNIELYMNQINTFWHRFWICIFKISKVLVWDPVPHFGAPTLLSLTNHNSISFSFITTSPFYPLVVPSTLLLYTIPTFSSFTMSFPLQLGGLEEHYNLPWVPTARWFLVLDAAKKSDFDEWCYNLTAMCFIHDHSCYFSFHVCFKFQSCLYCICLARIALS